VVQHKVNLVCKELKQMGQSDKGDFDKFIQELLESLELPEMEQSELLEMEQSELKPQKLLLPLTLVMGLLLMLFLVLGLGLVLGLRLGQGLGLFLVLWLEFCLGLWVFAPREGIVGPPLRALGLLLELVLLLVIGLGLVLGLVVAHDLLLGLGLGLGLVLVLVVVLAWKRINRQRLAEQQENHILKGFLASLLREEWRADLNDWRYQQLVRKKKSKLLVNMMTGLKLLEMFKAYLQIQVENIWPYKRNQS
jgi:hypothetical protein